MVDNVGPHHQLGTMRDDCYKSSPLPRAVRKLCRMAGRPADRANPERLRHQAVEVLHSDWRRDIGRKFNRQLQAYASKPDLFAAHGLAKLARSKLETDIAQNIEVGRGVENATCEALRRQGESYSREQKCVLITERHPQASAALESFKKALDEAAPIAARSVLNRRPAPRVRDCVRLDENLLAPPFNGAPR